MSSSSSSTSPTKTVVCGFPSREAFMEFLRHNPGLIIVKFGARWCSPCKRIKPVIDAFFATSPDMVVCCDVDVDESADVYAFMRSKKMVTGVPTLLCYTADNTSFIPNLSVSGADPKQLDMFFKSCGELLRRHTMPQRKNNLLHVLSGGKTLGS